MKLPEGLTPQEIRILQEYRRLAAKELTLEQIKAIKHPTGGGEAPAISLAQKGYLSADEGRTRFTLVEKGTEFLKVEAPLPFAERG